MMHLKCLILFGCIFSSLISFGQNESSASVSEKPSQIIWRDTVNNFVFDSTAHNFGNISPTHANERLVKYFKYIGTAPIAITRVWTGDPHFICQYPNELLIPNQIYSFTICFFHHGRQGELRKSMGFELSDGTRISFTFSGTYLPIAHSDH